MSVVLSIVFFNHPLNTMEAVGIFIVFAALLGQIAQKWRAKRHRPKKATEAITPPNAEEALVSGSVSDREDNVKASLLRTSDRAVSRSGD